MTTPEREIQENQATYRPKFPEIRPQMQDDGRRLVGCRFYPRVGYLAGAPVEWCLASQAEYCGNCRHKEGSK